MTRFLNDLFSPDQAWQWHQLRMGAMLNIYESLGIIHTQILGSWIQLRWWEREREREREKREKGERGEREKRERERESVTLSRSLSSRARSSLSLSLSLSRRFSRALCSLSLSLSTLSGDRWDGFCSFWAASYTQWDSCIYGCVEATDLMNVSLSLSQVIR